MELRELKTFLEIAQQKSFCKASIKLSYTQAAVTIQIKNLEEELGVQLFDRIGKKTSLTHAGEVFFDYANKIIQTVDNAKLVLAEKTELSGKLNIGTIDSVCSTILPQLTEKFHQQYPKVNINICVDTPATLIQKLNDNTVDFLYFLDKQIYDTKWIKEFEKQEDIVFVTSSTSKYATEKTLCMDEVLAMPLILTEQGASYRFMLEQYLAEDNKKLHPIIETGNTEFILNMLHRNLGVSFLPKFLVQDEINSGILKVLNVKLCNLHVWQQIVYHKDKWITNEMKAFIDIVKEHM